MGVNSLLFLTAPTSLKFFSLYVSTLFILDIIMQLLEDYASGEHQSLQSLHDDQTLIQRMMIQQSCLYCLAMLWVPKACFPQSLASVVVGADFAGPIEKGKRQSLRNMSLRNQHNLLKMPNI